MPDKLAFNTPNLNSTLGNIASSSQAMVAILSTLPTPTQNYYNNVVGPALIPTAAPGLTKGQTLWAALGLESLSSPQASGLNPSNMHEVNTDFDPTYHANELLVEGQWHQHINEWLESTLVAGYQHAGVDSQQSYYNTVGNPIYYSGAQQIALINAMAAYPGGGVYFNSAPASNFSLIHPTAVGGGIYTLSIPVSAYDAGNAGSQGGKISHYSSLNSGSDESSGSDVQKSVELRFNSNLSGPLNFMLAGYYLSYNDTTDYWVSAPQLDYASLMIGAMAFPVTNLTGLGANQPISSPVPLAVAPAAYHNAETYSLTSQAVFGEVYYDALPDTLKFTLGLRYTADDKRLTARTTLYNAFVPVGTTNVDSPVPFISNAAAGNGGLNGAEPFSTVLTKNTAMTGRFVVHYTPKLSFTDETLVYASAARGYKAGGANPALPASAPTSLNTYMPEYVNAYELGTKNTLLDGTLQANMDVWYYNYKNLQVATIVDQDSVNQNINATMWGLEGEFLWAPTDRWQFNLSAANNHSDIGNNALANPRNPTNGDPNATVIKDLGSAETCVVTHDAGFPVWSAVAAATPVPVVPGPVPTPGVADSGFSSCSHIPAVIAALPLIAPALAGHYHFFANGEPVNLKGNSLQNMPDASLGIGGQYTLPVSGGYSLTTRVDVYWQASMWGTIYNEAPIDKIQSYFISNAQVQLNAPNAKWYVRAFVNNMFDKTYVTGMYVSDPATGAFTNEFVGEPRTFGIVLGTKL